MSFQGKNCFITGGSQGLGMALAQELLCDGANVAIVARRENVLSTAIAELEEYKTGKGQRLFSIVGDVTDKESIGKAISEAEMIFGNAPDYVFSCAGSAKPGFFLEQDLDDFDAGMKLNYLGSLYTVKLAAERMVARGVKGHLVLISSTVGLMGMIGYSQYSPTKFAVRGLGECLRQELLSYGIQTHVYFVATIDSPGYEAENRLKPGITKEIEGADNSDKSPGSRAKVLLAGIRKGQFMITSDLTTDLFRVSAIGVSPRNNVVLDFLLMIVSWVVLPVWRMYADYLVVRRQKSD